MKNLRRGLCAALTAVGVVAVAGTAAAQRPADPTSPTADPTAPTGTDPIYGDPIYGDPHDPARPIDHRTPGADPLGQDRTDVDVDIYTTPQTTVVPTYTTEPVEDEGRMMPFGRVGFAISAGGGAAGFTDDTLRGATNDGGAWNVRATFGTRSPLAFEAAYIGSVQSIEALGLDENARLVGNGVQGNLRVNVLPESFVQPFIYAGAAWRRYDLTNTAQNLSNIADSDNVLEIPMGVGVAGKFSGLLLDVRGEFRAATREDLMPSLAIDEDMARMHRWGVNANIGYEF
jgi:hypothetical protein